jgi:hypothetical protein
MKMLRRTLIERPPAATSSETSTIVDLRLAIGGLTPDKALYRTPSVLALHSANNRIDRALGPISEGRNLTIVRVNPISQLGIGADHIAFGRPIDCHF